MDPKVCSEEFDDLDKLGPEMKGDLLARSRRIAVSELGLGYQFVLLYVLTLAMTFSIAIAPMLLFELSALESSPFIAVGAVFSLYVYRILERKILQRGYEELQKQVKQASPTFSD